MVGEQQESVRSEIEKCIVSSAGKILLGPDHECYDDEAAQDFLQAWRDLVEYYQNADDIMINVEVVREYRDWMNIFGGMKYHKGLSADCLARAEEAEAELKVYMDDIIIAVGRKLYPQGR
jgi:hypothetical protein